MLNNLDWLQEGQPFPPACEKERIERYAYNKLLFNNDHQAVYREQWQRIERVIGNMANIISYPIVLNFQKKISVKTADFLFQEEPKIKCDDDNKTKTVEKISKNSQLMAIGYEGAIDASRYGDCVFKIDIENNKGKISISSPEYLYTVVEPEDKKKVQYYVLAWCYSEGQGDSKKDYLVAYIHNKTSYEYRKYYFDNGTIGNLLESKSVKTGLTDFAIIPISNLTTSDSIYGIDDYMDVDSIVSELEIRTAQISKILDTHANPTVSGSSSALTDDGAGGYVFEGGGYYARSDKEEPPLEYIVWEASLKANFDQIERLLNYLSVISEMGAAIFNDAMKTGEIPSGSALKKLYINVLAKVSRLRNSFDAGLKKALSIASEVGYKKVNPEDINITWMDGLPNDEFEEAEIMKIRSGDKPTASVESLIMKYDGASQDEAETQIEKIADEEMQFNPTSTAEPERTVENENEDNQEDNNEGR